MGKCLDIALCMGSSCFTRGNDILLKHLEEYIDTNGLDEQICLSGTRCTNNCSTGPNLLLEGTLYSGLDEGAMFDLLKKHLEHTPDEKKG